MNWGIIGYGEIAPCFIKSLLSVKNQNLIAIASRSKHDLLKMQKVYPGVKLFADYSEIYECPDIDIVYVCTTNNLHKENVISSLHSGKHVLCEKPMGVCRSDTLEMIFAAKQYNKFLMEGMWTRFLPAYRRFIELIRDDAIGNIMFLNVDFGFRSTWGPERRLLNNTLFGGAILDNTDYNVFLACDVFNNIPSNILAHGNISETGVENSCSIIINFPGNKIAHSFSTFIQDTNQDAIVYGDKGKIFFKEFWHGKEFVLQRNSGESICIELPFESTGFVHEIIGVTDSIQRGLIENSIIPHDLSIGIAEILDQVILQVRK